MKKFVSKFKTRNLSDWEVATWMNKVYKTKSDAHHALFEDGSEVDTSVSEAFSQESLSNKEFEDKETDETNMQGNTLLLGFSTMSWPMRIFVLNFQMFQELKILMKS